MSEKRTKQTNDGERWMTMIMRWCHFFQMIMMETSQDDGRQTGMTSGVWLILWGPLYPRPRPGCQRSTAEEGRRAGKRRSEGKRALRVNQLIGLHYRTEQSHHRSGSAYSKQRTGSWKTYCQVVSQQLHDQRTVFVRIFTQCVELCNGFIESLGEAKHILAAGRMTSSNQWKMSIWRQNESCEM